MYNVIHNTSAWQIQYSSLLPLKMAPASRIDPMPKTSWQPGSSEALRQPTRPATLRRRQSAVFKQDASQPQRSCKPCRCSLEVELYSSCNNYLHAFSRRSDMRQNVLDAPPWTCFPPITNALPDTLLIWNDNDDLLSVPTQSCLDNTAIMRPPYLLAQTLW